MDKANVMLNDARLEDARQHFRKALGFFRQRSNPDFENVIKEALCAVEAAAKKLFGARSGATLRDVIKKLSGVGETDMPPALAKTFETLYGFRNSGAGVSHGGAVGGRATEAAADYTLSVAASQIIFLVELHRLQDTATPF